MELMPSHCMDKSMLSSLGSLAVGIEFFVQQMPDALEADQHEACNAQA